MSPYFSIRGEIMINFNERGTFGITGWGTYPAVDWGAAEEIKAVETPIKEIKQYVPNTKIFVGDGWTSVSLARDRELIGKAEVKAITEG